MADGANGPGPRRSSSSRAAAVAATLAAVASAKAAADDAVASVSSSGRHRSIGTSISDTLVVTRAGGGTAGAGSGARREEAVNRGGVRARPAAWPEPAPGKEDGGDAGRERSAVAANCGHLRRVGSDEDGAKWHKREAGEFSGSADEKARSPEGGGGGGGVRYAGGEAHRLRGDLDPTKLEEEATTSAAAPRPLSGLTPGPSSWSTSPTGMGAPAGEGGDSPPRLGSPELSPLAPPQSRRSPDNVRNRQISGVDAIIARSPIAFPTAAGVGLDRGIAGEGAGVLEGDFDGVVGVNGGGELGMTRPRTATRRWDRPGPPGDDEVISKALLSRAAVTSTLSNR